jgi:ribosome-associated protein
MQHTEDDDQAGISKSQRKRDMDELKKLGMELLEFSDDALRQLQMPETLLEAIRTGKRITSNNARKRQMQYIGKLLKDTDAAPLQEAVDARNHQHATHTREFHQLEELRDKLVLEGDSALPGPARNRKPDNRRALHGCCFDICVSCRKSRIICRALWK